MHTHRVQRIVGMACLVTSLIAPAAFAASPEPLKSLSSLEVVDTDDQKVGPVISLYKVDIQPAFIAAVVFEVDKQPFVVSVLATRFLSGSTEGPFFQSSDCSGTPLVRRDTQSIITMAVISAPGSTAYVAEPDATPFTVINFEGTRLRQGVGCEPAIVQNATTTFLAARAVVDLDTLFTPPFSVR